MVPYRPFHSRAARRFGAVVVLLFAAGPLGAQEESIAGTLPEDHLPALKSILATALQRSPQLIAAEFDRTLAEIRVMGADAARLPGVSGNLNFASNQTAVSSNTNSQTRDNGLFYSLGVSQPLFHWRALQNQSLSARLNRLIAEKSLERARRDLAVLLRKAYLALVVEKARWRAARETLQLARDELAVTAERFARGTISAAVVEGGKLRVREMQLEFDRQALEFDANRRRFARLAGLNELSETAVPDEIPLPKFSPDLAAALTASVLRSQAKSTLEYEIHDMRVRDAMLRVSIEKVRLYPKFYANASYGLENTTNVNGNSVVQQGIQRRTVSVFAQWTIFDGFASRAAIREAEASKRTLERQRQTEIENLLQNIQNMERSLKLDAEQMELAGIRHGMAVEGTKVIAREVEFGNQPRSELERAQATILQAEARSQESRAALLARWCEFVALATSDPALRSSSSRHAPESK